MSPANAVSKPIADRQEALLEVYAQFFGERNERRRPEPDRGGAGGFPGSNDELIAAARNARNGNRFSRLWDGDTSGHAGDDSAADLALCSHLAFWAGRDAERMDQLFRLSGLMRDKWDEPHFADGRTYGAATIQKAIEGCLECYEAGTKGAGQARRPAQDLPPIRNEGPLGLALEYRKATFTGARWSVLARLLVDAKDRGPIDATSTSTGRQKALTQVMTRLSDLGRRMEEPAEDEIRRWLDGALDPDRLPAIAAALRQRAAFGGEGRKEPAGVAAAFLRDRYGLAFRDPDGSLWSERLGQAVKSNELQQLGGPDLLAHLRRHALGFEDSDADPVAELGRAEKCARAAWGLLKAELPLETGAELGPDSTAAGRLRAEFLEALDSHQLRVGLRVDDSDRTWNWSSTTLASIARDWVAREAGHLRSTGEIPDRAPWSRWVRVHPGFDAWLQVTLDGNRLTAAIAIRPAILRQTRTGPARDPRAVTELARRYGLLDPCTPGVRVTGIDGAKVRALLLAPALTEDLLQNKDEEEPGPGEGAAS